MANHHRKRPSAAKKDHNSTNDDDDRSASSNSTHSYIKSILERRKHILPAYVPIVHRRPDFDEEEELSSWPSWSQSNNSSSMHRSSTSSKSKAGNSRSSKRKKKRKSSTHPFLLLVLACLASNWLATRILNTILREEIEDLYNEDRYNIEMEMKNKDAMAMDSSLPIRNDFGYTELTQRFINLRQRLLSLYSEEVPSDAPTSFNATKPLHPLYNAHSPQRQALDWIANIDQLRLKPSDPGLIQRYALAVLYFSTGGPPVDKDTDFTKKVQGPWRNPTNFLAPTHECDWKSFITRGAGRGGGIRRCDRNQTVVEISLYNELTGTVPSEIGRLWNLRTLYLGRNKLTGTIPTELGMINKLSSLSLQHNDLSGDISIPEQYLAMGLKTLRALQIEGNVKITGNIHTHSLLCQMRNKYRGNTPKGQERYNGKKVLRILTATCVPPGQHTAGRLECACCTECKETVNTHVPKGIW